MVTWFKLYVKPVVITLLLYLNIYNNKFQFIMHHIILVLKYINIVKHKHLKLVFLELMNMLKHNYLHSNELSTCLNSLSNHSFHKPKGFLAQELNLLIFS